MQAEGFERPGGEPVEQGEADPRWPEAAGEWSVLIRHAIAPTVATVEPEWGRQRSLICLPSRHFSSKQQCPTPSTRRPAIPAWNHSAAGPGAVMPTATSPAHQPVNLGMSAFTSARAGLLGDATTHVSAIGFEPTPALLPDAPD